MSRESRVTAGVLLILLPTVVYGGASILSLLVGDPAYAQNQLRQDLWRAGHAHAGVLLILSLVTLRYVDEARLPEGMKRLARHSIPAAAILLPAAFFLSVLSPEATEPNALIHLAYAGAVSLAVGLLVLGVGLIRGGRVLVLKKAEHDHEKAMVGRSDGAPVLTLGTDNVRAVYERLRERGVRFLGEPYRYPWGLAAILLDQDDSPILLQEESGEQ